MFAAIRTWDGCRVQAVEAKRAFYGMARSDHLEQLDEMAYNYWYTRLRKLKNGKNADPKKAAVIKAAFDTFRKVAVRKKGEVKRGEMKLSEFASWLALKNDEVDRLMETETEELVAIEERMQALKNGTLLWVSLFNVETVAVDFLPMQKIHLCGRSLCSCPPRARLLRCP
jgi:hypothetical protein